MISTVPETLLISPRYFRNDWNRVKNLPSASDASTKGIASPIEYARSSSNPRERLAELAAYVRIAPSTGPMQGVQPKAKASPMR